MRYLLLGLAVLFGCSAPLPPAHVPPPLPVPTHTTTPTGDSIWLYRDSLYGYSQYLKHYMDSLTVVYRLPPFQPPLDVKVIPTPLPVLKPECVDKPIKLPPVPNIALTETAEEERDLLISHIEDIRRLVTIHNRSLCKP